MVKTKEVIDVIFFYRAEFGKIWLSIVKGFCGWAHKRGMRAAEEVICKNQWKSCWKWKVGLYR